MSKPAPLVAGFAHCAAMFSPDTLDVVMVSFEGPDQYSQAGGLGVRARELCRAFAALGYRTTLVFVGDPDKPGVELDQGVQLVRWCQQLSDRYRTGVYEGELGKIRDLTATLPDALIDSILRPAAEAGRVTAVLCEEWHTAWFCRALSDRLHTLGLRESAVLLWNANNLFGFEAIDWPILDFVASVTTVSKYMKHLMWPYGVNPVVIPNGIPESALAPVDGSAARAIRAAAGSPCLTFKIGRFSPDKRWTQAVAAIAELRSEGLPARMLIRGGMEPYGATVLAFAAERGLAVTDWYEPVEDAGGIVRAPRPTARRLSTCAVSSPTRWSPRSMWRQPPSSPTRGTSHSDSSASRRWRPGAWRWWARPVRSTPAHTATRSWSRQTTRLRSRAPCAGSSNSRLSVNGCASRHASTRPTSPGPS